MGKWEDEAVDRPLRREAPHLGDEGTSAFSHPLDSGFSAHIRAGIRYDGGAVKERPKWRGRW